MLVLVKEPGKEPKRVDVSEDLESMKELVGGYIESVHIPSLSNMKIMVLVDDEGLLKEKSPNIVRVDRSKNILDCLHGNVVFTGSKQTIDGLEWVSLTENQIDFLYENIFDAPLKYTSEGGLILDSVSMVLV
jgi:hypothetical protein